MLRTISPARCGRAIRSGALVFAAVACREVVAQAAPLRPRNELTVHAEPLAAGARYAFAAGTRWRIGPSLTIGPFKGVTLRRGQSGELREWATTYATVSFSPHDRVDLILSPIGAALAIGDDFSSVYPSAQLGVQTGGRRWVLGTDFRVMRIAGPNGTGDYWLQWVPVRIGLRWRR
jgi:hypothetical protein